MKQYIVDAFTEQVFHGNQAAVCVMEQWLPENLMMSIRFIVVYHPFHNCSGVLPFCSVNNRGWQNVAGKWKFLHHQRRVHLDNIQPKRSVAFKRKAIAAQKG